MKDFYDLIDGRATCRSFLPDQIPAEVLERILAAGCKSPSGGGFQNVSVVAVTDPDKRKKLVELSRGQKFIGVAPVSLVFCVDYRRVDQVLAREPAPFRETGQFKYFWMSLLDTAIMAQTMVLAAEAEGLGSCYNGNIINRAADLTQLLRLPPRVFPAVMLTLGVPRVKPKQPPKYPAELLVHWNEYQDRPDEDVYKAYRKQNRYQKLEAKPERVEACCQMAEQLHGAEYAQKVRQDIADKGYMGPYQYWFGCWYTEDPEFMRQSDYPDYFKKQGFDWLNFD